MPTAGPYTTTAPMTQPHGYHDHINHDLLARLPVDAQRVLEIGCGSGALAVAYRQRNPGAHYTGVEKAPRPAQQAAARLHATVHGDIEAPACLAALDRHAQGKQWDLIVCGDVLEHLLDPLRTLADLRLRTRPGGQCMACIPNIGHYSIVHQLLRAQWNYADAGLLDRTHLRFFTLPTMAALFQQSGWVLRECTARVIDEAATTRGIASLLPLAPVLGLDPAQMQLHLSAYQWIVRAENPVQP